MPSSAIENGLTAQLTSRVTPMPRQCAPTPRKAPKSTFISIGTIISQISTATGRLMLASSIAPSATNARGNRCPSKVPTPMHASTHNVR